MYIENQRIIPLFRPWHCRESEVPDQGDLETSGLFIPLEPSTVDTMVYLDIRTGEPGAIPLLRIRPNKEPWAPGQEA